MWQLDKDHKRLFLSKNLNRRLKKWEKNNIRNQEGGNTKNTANSFKIYKRVIHIILCQ